MKFCRVCLTFIILSFFVVYFLGLSPNPGAAAELKISGNWPLFHLSASLVPSNHLISTAGPVRLSVIGTGNSSSPWCIRAEVSPPSPGSSGLGLFLRRTDDGLGPGRVSGGKTFCQLSTRSVEIFRGEGDRTNIPLQLQVKPLSPIAAPGNWDLQIRFTLEVQP